MIYKVVKCDGCRKFFSTTSKSRCKCPRCGKSQETKSVYTTQDGLKAAAVVGNLGLV